MTKSRFVRCFVCSFLIIVKKINFRASFFDQTSLYTKTNFVQFLAVLVTGYAICILLLYLTNLGINKWEMEPNTKYPNKTEDDLYEEKIAEEQDELTEQLTEPSFIFLLYRPICTFHRKP